EEAHKSPQAVSPNVIYARTLIQKGIKRHILQVNE
ncbi:hypothetical protein AVDCRST_MAG94-6901, partial [uncultured Leptolyngbya sp.]